MPRSSEEISNYNSSSGGRTDANLANDSNHLGGVPAEQYATQEYVQRYHNTKEAAQKEIDQIHNNKNGLIIAENLIKTKGFEDVVILINDDSINAVVQKDKLNKEDIAQIQSIIARELNAKIEDIHISNQ